MLEYILTLNAFHVTLVFVRLGSAFMVLPGFALTYVSVRVRLLIAIMTTLVVMPLVQPMLPPLPGTTGELIRLILLEVFFGLFIGLLGQVIMAALHFAGTSISRDMGLMNAMVFDPVTEQQGALMIGFLANIAVVTLFILDMHHVMLRAVVGSYSLFVPGQVPLVEDHLAMFTDLLARAFYLGLQLAAPFLVFVIVFQTSMGVMARLTPQMNVFFVGLPLQIMVGFALLSIALPAFIMWFMRFFEDSFMVFVPQ